MLNAILEIQRLTYFSSLPNDLISIASPLMLVNATPILENKKKCYLKNDRRKYLFLVNIYALTESSVMEKCSR